jgi:hypothetical protein
VEANHPLIDPFVAAASAKIGAGPKVHDKVIIK